MKNTTKLWTRLIVSWLIVIALLFLVSFLIPRTLSVTSKLVIQNTIMLLATYLIGKFLIQIRPRFFSKNRLLSQVLVILPVLLYLAIMVFGTAVNLSNKSGNIASILVNAAILGLFAALFEEFYFRGLLQTAIFRAYSGAKSIYLSVFISSLLFSLSHLIVNYSPGDASGVVLQTIATFGSGLYMAALFLRTRNILWPLLLHGVNDFVGIASTDGSIAPTGTQTGGGIGLQLITTLIFIVITLFILRKSKHEEIISQFSEGDMQY